MPSSKKPSPFLPARFRKTGPFASLVQGGFLLARSEAVLISLCPLRAYLVLPCTALRGTVGTQMLRVTARWHLLCWLLGLHACKAT